MTFDEIFNELDGAMVQQDLLKSEKAALRKDLIPAEVTQKLDDLDAEYEDKEKLLTEKIETLTEQAKEAVKAMGVSVNVGTIQLVYTTPKPKVGDIDALIRYINDGHTELGYLITTSKPSVALKRRGG
jgi:hypothetical protein